MPVCCQNPGEGLSDALGSQLLLNIHYEKMNCLKPKELQHARSTLVDTTLVQVDVQYCHSCQWGLLCARSDSETNKQGI